MCSRKGFKACLLIRKGKIIVREWLIDGRHRGRISLLAEMSQVWSFWDNYHQMSVCFMSALRSVGAWQGSPNRLCSGPFWPEAHLKPVVELFGFLRSNDCTPIHLFPGAQHCSWLRGDMLCGIVYVTNRIKCSVWPTGSCWYLAILKIW